MPKPQPEVHADRPTWHASPSDAVVSRLEADTAKGLQAQDITRRRHRFGPNRIETHGHTTWYSVLLRQFMDVLIGILLVAAGVSFVIGETLDGTAILAIVLLNGLLGFIQEWRAERALEALQKTLALRCTVLRDGSPREVEASSLVPGDIVLLRSGDRVPADLRLFDTHELQVDESSLTGESLPVAKDTEPVARDCPLAERSGMAWMGTTVTGGHARGVVTDTGMSTEFGRIAELTHSVERDRTPLQRRLAALGTQLGLLALAVSILVALVGWMLGRPALEMFMTAVSLAVAVVPEGLPAVVTVTLALGVRQMTRQRALPRRLQAAETLGSATTILTDKTGTLTENEMSVARIWLPAGEIDVSGSGYTPEGTFRTSAGEVDPAQTPGLLALLEAGLACNNSGIEQRAGVWHRVGDPTEAALIVAARKADLEGQTAAPIAEFGFDSTRKRMTVIQAAEQGWLASTKGAPEIVLERCVSVLDADGVRPMRTSDRERAAQAYRAFAQDGMRTLALATRELSSRTPMTADVVEMDLTLLGIVGIIDLPRPEVAEAIARATASGIRVIMITGDAPETARAVAERIGMPVAHTLTGPELDRMDDLELVRELARPLLFARTTPEHKLRVTRVLRGTGQVVGMTGDGVNDAPALKEADIGIAMGIRGTDVAREAADLVLTDDNFASIVNAVQEGRREYDNIRKFVRYLLSSNVGETIAIFICILLDAPLILLPVQILWINVVTDTVTAIALGLEPPEKDVMRRPPRTRDEPILDRSGILAVLGLGGYIGVATLVLFLVFLRGDPASNLLLAQTVAFTCMVVFEQVNLLNHRALRSPLHSIGFFSNPWLLVALAGTAGLHLAALYTPFLQRVLHTTALGWLEWAVVLLVSLPLFLVPEALKWARYNKARAPARNA